MQFSLPAIHRDSSARFENFWIGKNQQLVEHLRSLNTSDSINLAFIYGAGGWGKTHLLHACLHAPESSSMQPHYLPLGDSNFQSKMIDHFSGNEIVLIDDVDVYAGGDVEERRLFRLYERSRENGGKLVITANKNLDQCGFALKDLRSRLGAGLIFQLEPIAKEELRQAVEMRAKRRGLVFSDSALSYLLSRAPRHQGSIFMLLAEIDKCSLAEQRRITIPFLKTILSSGKASEE